MVRMLLNTRRGLPDRYRAEVVDSFGVKLLGMVKSKPGGSL